MKKSMKAPMIDRTMLMMSSARNMVTWSGIVGSCGMVIRGLRDELDFLAQQFGDRFANVDERFLFIGGRIGRAELEDVPACRDHDQQGAHVALLRLEPKRRNTAGILSAVFREQEGADALGLDLGQHLKNAGEGIDELTLVRRRREPVG